MTTKTDEQEIADFEAWEKTAPVITTFAAWKAGRAALQSQDREDAERYRHLRDKGGLDPHDIFNAWWLADTGNPQTLDEAIDHARRIEEEGE